MEVTLLSKNKNNELAPPHIRNIISMFAVEFILLFLCLADQVLQVQQVMLS